MKILVTGASGGLGRLIIPRLLDLGHEVIATSKSLEKAKELDFFDKVTYLPFDISKPTRTNLFYYFQQPDSVIHLAWDKLNDYRSEDHTSVILEHHKAFVYNIISNGLKDFNGVGTCYEYGLIEGELDESVNGTPVLPYPMGKKMLLDFITDMQNEFQFSLKWIRVFYVFGDIIGRKNLYTMLNQAIQNKQESFDMSGGEQIRDFLTPQQIAQYIIEITLQKQVVGIINCCSGKPVKLKDYVQDYIKSKGSNLKLNLGVYPYPDYEPMNTWGSILKLSKIITKE